MRHMQGWSTDTWLLGTLLKASAVCCIPWALRSFFSLVPSVSDHAAGRVNCCVAPAGWLGFLLFPARMEQTYSHLQGGGSRTKATDIICPMYARIDEITSFANIPTETRPVIQCEYAHAMGNSNGNYKVRGP